MTTSEVHPFSMNIVVSLFLLCVGHETTSIGITRVLEILSIHQDLQDRLRAEILKARTDTRGSADLPYDIITTLPLLDATIRETMRL